MTDVNIIRDYLGSSKTIAVLGASPNHGRAGFYVPEYLNQVGYRVIPVNPGHAGKILWGEKVRAGLAEVGEPIDILNIFRRSETLDAHLEEILALEPRLVWLQLGIRNDAFAQKLEAAGIPVVQDSCLEVVHSALMG